MLLLYLLLVVVVAVVGGFLPAAAAAVASFLLANWYFTPPFHHFRIAKQADVLALGVLIAVAGVVSALVDLAARRSAEAARARAEAEALARLGGTLLHGQDRSLSWWNTSGRRSGRSRSPCCAETAGLVGGGGRRPQGPDPARVRYRHGRVGPQTTLALVGRRLSGDDRRVLRAFTDQLGVALESRRLSRAAAEAALLAEANQLRTALLAAVSHDLRTPWPRSRPRSRACSRTTCGSHPRRPPSCWPPSTSRLTGWIGWSGTWWT